MFAILTAHKIRSLGMVLFCQWKLIIAINLVQLKTKAFNHFIGLGNRNCILKERLGLDNLIVYAQADNISHNGVISPYSFKYNFEGKTYYELDKTRIVISANKYVFINNGQFYKCETENKTAVKSLIIFFSADTFKQAALSHFHNDDSLLDNYSIYTNGDLNFFQKTSTPSAAANSQIHSIAEAISWNYDTLLLDELLHLITREICKDQESFCKLVDMQPAKKISTKIELFKRITVAYDYIQANYQQPIQLDELARVANMAPFHFIRVFKKNFKHSPYQLISDLRLCEARNLLINTDLPITAISEKIGFENPSSFTRLFVKYYHTAPFYFRAGNCNVKISRNGKMPIEGIKLFCRK